MKIAFRGGAEQDIAAIAEFYAAAGPGLGAQFFEELDKSLSLLRRQRYAGATVPGQTGFRQLLLNRFPYRLIYRVTSEAIIVIAVCHQRQHPRLWWNRVQEQAPIYMAA